MTGSEAIAAVAMEALREARSQATAPSGSISVTNADGSRTVMGAANATGSTIATHVGDVEAPGRPTGVSARADGLSVSVSWDGTLEGGVPADFHCVTVLVDDAAVGTLDHKGTVTVVVDAGRHEVSATAEDDACLGDGTPAHNVSGRCPAIVVTATDAAAEARRGIEEAKARAEELDARIEADVAAVRRDADAYRAEAGATYSTKEEVDSKTGAIARTLAADYTRTADLAGTQAVADAKKAGTDASAALGAYKGKVAETYAERAELASAVNRLSSTMTSNYSAFEDYRASNDTALSKAQTDATAAQSALDGYRAANDRAVADAKAAGTTAQGQLSSYRGTNDAAVAAARKVGADAASALASYRAANDARVDELRNIADAAIETWTMSGTPTASNRPASDWTTPELRRRHQGDVYFDADTGYSYRWDGSSWAKVKNSDVTKALGEIETIKTDYATRSELSSTDAALRASIGDTLSQAKTYAGGIVGEERTARVAAISAKASEIEASVSRSYTSKTTFADWQRDADGRIASAKADAGTARSTAATAASDAATAKADAGIAKAGAASAVGTANAAAASADGAASAAVAARAAVDDLRAEAEETYATKAQLATTDGRVAAEVSARQQTDVRLAQVDGRFASYSTTTQTAAAIEAKADSVSSEVSATYETKSEASSKRAELSSRIDQTATAVSAKVSQGGSGIASIDSVAKLDSSGLSIGRRVNGAWAGLRQLLTGAAMRFVDQAGKTVAEVAADRVSLLGGQAVIRAAGEGSGHYASIETNNLHVTSRVGSREASLNTYAGPNTSYAGISARDISKSSAVFLTSDLITLSSGGMRFGQGSGASGGTAITGIWAGTKVFQFLGGETQMFSKAEFEAITGTTPHSTRTVVLVMSGDDGAYRGNLTASIQGDTNVIVKANPNKSGAIRINYLIVTWK